MRYNNKPFLFWVSLWYRAGSSHTDRRHGNGMSDRDRRSTMGAMSMDRYSVRKYPFTIIWNIHLLLKQLIIFNEICLSKRDPHSIQEIPIMRLGPQWIRCGVALEWMVVHVTESVRNTTIMRETVHTIPIAIIIIDSHLVHHTAQITESNRTVRHENVGVCHRECPAHRHRLYGRTVNHRVICPTSNKYNSKIYQ